MKSGFAPERGASHPRSKSKGPPPSRSFATQAALSLREGAFVLLSEPNVPASEAIPRAFMTSAPSRGADPCAGSA